MNTNNNEELIDILWALEKSNEKLEETIGKKYTKQELIPEKETQIEEKENNTYIENSSNDIFEEEINNNISETKKINVFLNTFIFWIKYVVTSVFIFSVLLLTTNYSAYISIAKSYIYENETKQESISLLNWAEASDIIENEKNTEVINEKDTEVINKTEKNNIKKNKYHHNDKLIIPAKSKEEKINDLIKKTEKKSKEWKRFSMSKLISNLKNEEINLWINIIPYENRIVIPKIGKNVPLIDIKKESVKWKLKLDNILMKELEFWVVRYPWSAKPGTNWNSFIFWHSSNFPWIAWNYNDVFSRLWQVNKGDIVYSYYNQKRYKYKIVTKKVIKPNDVSILKRDKNKKELTLMTCWPVWTTLNRLILIWELIED